MPLPVRPEERGRGRSWRRSAGTIAVAIVILAVGFAVPVARGLLDDKPVPRSGGDTWRRPARPPTGFISHAADPAPIWTGAEVLVWDGANIDDTSGKWIDGGRGAAYNPATDRWRQLPKAPVPGRAMPLTAWTGDRAIRIGGINVGDQPRMDRGNVVAITEQGGGLPSSRHAKRRVGKTA
jgi:hypothetical protein